MNQRPVGGGERHETALGCSAFILAPIVAAVFMAMLAVPYFVGEAVGSPAFGLVLYVPYLILLNRAYNGWQKVKGVRASVAEAERNFAYFEHQRASVEWGELSVGDGWSEQFETNAAKAAERAVIERRRLPSTLDEWFRVLVLDVDPPGRQ